MNNLWVEKYRPDTIDGYVFKDDTFKKKVVHFIETKDIPHLLLCGGAGTGKTTLAKLLINEIDILDADVLYVNASRETGVDTFRNKVTKFCESGAYGDFKIVLLDEADFLSKNAQGILRVMLEQYSKHVRFIMTCNFVHKILTPIQSRTQKFEFKELDEEAYTLRVLSILQDEGIEFEPENLLNYVDAFYPDLRKTINELQRGITDGKLGVLEHVDPFTIFNTFLDGKFVQARKDIVKLNMEDNDYHKFYNTLLEYIEVQFGENLTVLNEGVNIIATYIAQHDRTLDQALNLSACMGELVILINPPALSGG